MEYELESIEMWIDIEQTGFREQRLWAAIVLATITEYENWLRRIEQIWRETERPVFAELFQEVEQVRRHIEHDWFWHICDLAGVQYLSVTKALDKLDREYCIGSIPRDATGELIPRWQYHGRKAARARH